ncbi:Hsp20/alpha crystallin family protein [Polymorphum gilvum]|uniref:Second small heat shock protein-like protein n=1 Tax=Polymorphum gilvum (strain LMG 25793 / CGMCC 1.9160 / SL003B-26A1) TaxID=991905 RepID=F2J0X9_POLGS|nr:Hsp20/alpha crystallin family protein [Polymorphum gilvum]ADZ71925.1 second small heat shock protein-like protein [Polymorphum gilvum SL003B-26A1]
MALLPTLWDDKRDPFAVMRKEMNRLFGEVQKKLPDVEWFGAGFPAIDVTETEAGLELTAELPGVAEKDIDISVSDRLLTIKGEKRAEKEIKEEDRHVTERSYGSFRRAMTLPFAPDPDKVEAHMDNGVLTVHLPKPVEAQEQTRKIEVKRKG